MSEGRERAQAGQVGHRDGLMEPRIGDRAPRVVLRSEIHTDRGTHMTSNATTQTEALLLTETKDGIATLT
jgi:hypothetical protein